MYNTQLTSKPFKKYEEGLIANEIEDLIHTTLKSQDYFRLCTSGGSSTKIVLEKLSKSNIVDWSRIVIYQTDERIINNHHHDSNFYWINFFFKDVKVIKKCFYNEVDVLSSVVNYKNYLSQYCIHDSCHFDLLILGFGTDGHVASLFPNSDDLNFEDDLLFIKKRQNGYQRLSLSLSRIKNSKKTFIISYGDKKFNIIKHNLNLNLPINLFLKNQLNVTWYHTK